MSDEEGDNVDSSPLYQDNPDWKDVTPIYPSPEEECAVRIAYTPQFRDAFAYLRAVLQTNEMSPRTLRLTEDCVQLNPANYTLWQYRREIIKSLKLNLTDEMKYIDDIIMETPKNYQVWHHRRAIVDWIGESAIAGELSFTDHIIADESKNYHAWQHRQWVIRKWLNSIDTDLELGFSLKMIMDDPRNNSAWNYRYFILQNKNLLAAEETLAIEFNLAKRLVEKMPNNESIWNYLAGLCLDSGLTAQTGVVEFVEDLYERTEPAKRSPYLISFVCDILLEKIEKSQDAEASMNRAKQLYTELLELDPVRVNYWNHQQKVAENMFQKQTFRTTAK